MVLVKLKSEYGFQLPMLRLWFPMAHQSPATRPSLLLRIRNSGDQAAWQQFVEIYGPLIHGYCRHHGLQDSDAADLVQEVLQSVARAIGKLDYDPRRGAFRGWLFTITRNKMRDFLGREQRQVRGALHPGYGRQGAAVATEHRRRGGGLG